MEHDGVKTEFQITEVKEGSFAYDQGARFDVKVLTDGHDCGNGRFCADLNEAHEYCQQFADSIAGIGESLDDMCEDRSEIASAIQDAMRYGMEGVGLPMLDAAEHLANY